MPFWLRHPAASVTPHEKCPLFSPFEMSASTGGLHAQDRRQVVARAERPVGAVGVMAYYDCPISTGPSEGTNNKIKTMKRKAYDYRDKEFFKLKILAAHETKYALVG